MQRQLAMMVTQRDALLRDLGGLLFEMYRHHMLNRRLLESKCTELWELDIQVKQLSRTLSGMPALGPQSRGDLGESARPARRPDPEPERRPRETPAREEPRRGGREESPPPSSPKEEGSAHESG